MIKKWDIFHGKGVSRWDSPAAKNLFATSFMTIADKCFYAPLVPLASLAFYPTYVGGAQLAVQFVLSILLVWVGLVMRHEAMETLDEIGSAPPRITANDGSR